MTPSAFAVFTVFGDAAPKGSARAFVAGGRAVVTHDNKRTKPWQQCVQAEALLARQRMAVPRVLAGAVEVAVKFYFARPKSVSASRRPHHTVKPDLDKLARTVLDALTHVLIDDDAQVVSIAARKEYCTALDTPRAEIVVMELL